MSLKVEIVRKILKRWMPHVEPLDVRTFHVQSESNAARKYLVDLTENWGHGRCTCVDWQVRRNANLKAGYRAQKKCWCKHIEQASRYWHFQTILATAPDEALAEGVLDAPDELSRAKAREAEAEGACAEAGF